jgi:flagellum-specific ATP synthase
VTLLAGELERVREAQAVRVVGRVASLRGLMVAVDELPLPAGALVRVLPAHGAGGVGAGVLGEVVGFRESQTLVMLLGHTAGMRAGDAVEGVQRTQTAAVGARLLGRIVDGLGQPIDGAGPVRQTVPMALNPRPIGPLARRRITQPLRTGVRAMDLMTPMGRGQRLGIFAGPGVGKSTLLGQIARGTDADVNVIALIGERGREVRDFIEQSLGAEGLARSVVVVATGDEAPLLRLRAAKLACCAAEWFRDAGRSVLLMMDSVTRFAHAQRQVGLSVGEPPATKGYTPSVFAELGLLLERAGAIEGRDGGERGGSITGLYTILVEGDDMTEPVSDAARGILDGHVILSRRLAQKGHFPAIDVLDSVSRVAGEVADREHLAARQQVLRLLAQYRDVEELVQIGAYARGSNPEADVAIEHARGMNELLTQRTDERPAWEGARQALVKLAYETGDAIAGKRQQLAAGGRLTPAGVDATRRAS